MLQRMMTVALVLTFATFLHAGDAESSRLPPATQKTQTPNAVAALGGTYRGKVRSAGVNATVVTVFTRDANGLLAGTYTIGEGPEAYSGTLRDFLATDPDGVACRWIDRFGQGVLTFKLRPDGKRFVGQWGPEDDLPTEPWDGAMITPFTPATKPAP